MTKNMRHKKNLNILCIIAFVTLVIVPLLSCSSNNSREKNHPKSVTESYDAPSPAFDPSELSKEQQTLFEDLDPANQQNFIKLSPKKRIYLLEILKKFSANEAVWRAAWQIILEEKLAGQDLYKRLNPRMRMLFLTFDEEATDAAIRYVNNMKPNLAVKRAEAIEIKDYSKILKRFFQKMSEKMQILFLTLSQTSQASLLDLSPGDDIDKAVEKAGKADIERLPQREQEFISLLNSDEQILFLILTPEARSMAMGLTKQLDFNQALGYARSIITTDSPENLTPDLE